MKKCHLQKIRAIAMIAMAMMAFGFTSCKKGQEQKTAQQKVEDEKEARYWQMITESWEAKDEHMLPVIDSLEAIGELSQARADFARGVTYDRARHVKVGETYYAKVYEEADPEKEGWGFYLEVANRLAQIRMTMSDNQGSIAVATDIMERAEKAGKLNDSFKAAFLWSIAACQRELGLAEAEQTQKEVYELLEERAKKNRDGISINLLVYTYIITESKLGQGKCDEAEAWLKKADDMLKKFTQPGDSAIVREYTSNLAMARVHLLEGRGRDDLAYAYFRKMLPQIVISPECVSAAARYLLDKEKFDEAADLYNYIDRTTPADNRESEVNLENIAWNMIPRLKANIGAGRADSVMSIASRLTDSYIEALDKDRESNATEMAIIYDTQGKERQIAEQQASMSKQRSIAMMVILVLMTVFFIIYSWYRRRAENKLGSMLVKLQDAHEDLQKAYDQLEETTSAKERIESELRIARDIQMSMVPGIFPEYEGLDMYAEMNPAKEVGGDLYCYVMQGHQLYFCVGDVSGKGVPASLFMAQSARLFRTLATECMMPADIAVRMNNELAENNDRGMFVTMFIGLLHLGTGRLDFCNCGHNPPVLVNEGVTAAFLEMKYDNQPLGLWEDDPFVGESIEDIRGRQLLIYTDGLNEAENQEKELLGNKRLLELMTDTATLDSHQVIDMLKEAVEQHRAGAEPNDDLTLMCIQLAK